MTTDDAMEPAQDEMSVAEAAQEPAGRPKPKKQRKHLPIWQESILLLVIALGLAIVIKAFFVQAFYIPSASMMPGLQGGDGVPTSDRILVEKPSYWFGGNPSRGDVVVFSDPGGWLDPSEDVAPKGIANLLAKVGLYPTGGHLVKRVIGTPGDVIHCCNTKGQVEINGHAVDEDTFLSKSAQNAACDAVLGGKIALAGSKYVNECDWTVGPVPSGKLFVMGDNRTDSADSRAHICTPDEDPCTLSPWVPEDDVVGKVFALVWPQSRWKWIGTAEAFKDVPDPK
ncbi:signal peptidase I [Nocardioides montaniterrae]